MIGASGIASKLTAGLLCAALLTACSQPGQKQSPRPAPRLAQPKPAPVPATLPKADYAPSPASLELQRYYRSIETNLVSQGLLRRDGGAADTPFSKRQLVENFIRIAAFNEYTYDGSRFSGRSSEGQIMRWKKPVRLSVEFGPSMSGAAHARDQKIIEAYSRRLQKVTGHPITLTRGAGNFHVAVLSVDELAAYAPRLRQLVPGLGQALAEQITTLPRDSYCAVYTFSATPASSSERPQEFQTAVAIIRSENPDLLRESCYHEEIAQGLGLPNDSAAARPSIFNDDKEFALLTRHDELLLKILYDTRLPLGATPQEARPVVEVLASELLGGES